MQNLYSKLNFDNPNLFLDILKIRQMKKQDSIIIWVGEKRSGKTWGGIKLAETLNPNFDVKKGLYFEASPFLKYWNSTTNEVIIFDEGSESYSAREWWQIQNTIFNSLLTREGFRQNILIITLPVLSDLDKRAIRLSHFLITSYGVNIDKRYSFAMIYRLKMFQFMGKTCPIGIQGMQFHKATDKNLIEYERMKKEWNMKKSEQNITLLEQLENPETYQKTLKYEDYLNMFRKNVIDSEEFKRKLLRLNYNESDIDFTINLVEIERKLKIEQEIKMKELDNIVNFRQNILDDGSIELITI